MHGGWHHAGGAALCSRYVSEAHGLPPYDEHSEAWKAALIGLMEQEQFDLIYLPLYASFESEYLLCAKSW